MAKKRRRKLRLKKGPFLILLLIITSLIGLYYYTHTSKYLFFKGLNKSYDTLISDYETFIDNYLPYTNENYYNNTDTSLKLQTADLDENINFKGDIYLTDSDSYFDLDTKINDLSYDLNLLLRKKILYFKVDDSQFYSTPYEKSAIYNSDTFPKLMEIFIKSAKANMNNAKFSKSDEEIEVNGNKYKTQKITLNLTNKDYWKIMKSFYENVKKNNKVTEYLLGLGDYDDIDSLMKYIDSQIDVYEYKIANEKEKDAICNYSIYYYRSKPIKNELILVDDITYHIAYYNYKKYFELNYSENDQDNSYIKINDKKIDIFIDGLGYGSGTYDEDSINVEFTDYSKESLGHIKYLINDGEEISLDLNIDLDGFDLSIISKNKIEIDKRIPSIDVSNSVTSDNMTSDDKESIQGVLSVLNDIFTF